MKKEWLNRLIYLFFAILITSIVFGVSFRFHRLDGNYYSIDGHKYAMFGDMVYGKAQKPYVTRALLPTATGLISSVVRLGISEEREESMRLSLFRDGRLKEMFVKHVWDESLYIEYSVAVILLYLALLGFLFSFRYFFSGLFDAPKVFIDIVSLIVMAGLPRLFKYYNYLYDFPALFLFTLGLALMVRKRWQAFIVVFLFACINKETTILLTVLFFIRYVDGKKMGRLQFKRLLVAQLLIFIFVRSVLYLIYKDNSGGALRFPLFQHNLPVLVRLLTSYSLAGLLGLSFLVFLMFYRWSEQPEFLRSAIWIVAIHLFLILLFGFLEELRVYYEVYPIIVACMFYTVGRLLGVSVTVALDSEKQKI